MLKLVPENEESRSWTKTISDGRAADAEVDLWNATKESNLVTDFERYLAKYPQGEFAGAARAKIQELTVSSWRPRIERDIRERRWDDAESNIDRLLKLVPDNDEIRTWRRTISLSRTTDRTKVDDKDLTGISRDKLATVWLYRNSKSPFLRSGTMAVDGKVVVKLSNGKFVGVLLPAGQYRFSLEPGRLEKKTWDDLDIAVAAGEHVFIRYNWGTAVQRVDEAQAREDFKKLLPSDRNDINFTFTVVTRPPFN